MAHLAIFPDHRHKTLNFADRKGPLMTHKTWVDPTSEDLASYPPQTVFEAGLRNHDIANTAYPIAHTRTWGPYRVPHQQHRGGGPASLCRRR